VDFVVFKAEKGPEEERLVDVSPHFRFMIMLSQVKAKIYSVDGLSAHAKIKTNL